MLADEIKISKQAQEALKAQKGENEMLKEEIETLRLDLELHNQIPAGSAGASSGSRSAGGEGSISRGVSLNRSLGSEIERIMRERHGFGDKGGFSGDGTDDEAGGPRRTRNSSGDSYVHEVLTGDSQPSVVAPPITESSRLRGAWRWTSRPSKILDAPFAHASATASSTGVNLFAPAAHSYVSSIVRSSITFVLFAILMYLAGAITAAAISPTKHHHHLAPYSVMLGDDRPMWRHYMREGFAPRVGGWSQESVVEGVWNWLEG